MAASGTIPTRSIGRLYKWQVSESDGGESARLLVGRPEGGGIRALKQPKVVDSVSCRQMFLRSYTFSRKESFSEKTKKCLGRVLVLFRLKGRGFQDIRRPRKRTNRKATPKHRHEMTPNVGVKEALSKFRRLLLYFGSVNIVKPSGLAAYGALNCDSKKAIMALSGLFWSFICGSSEHAIRWLITLPERSVVQ
uniref:Uncharacterized protein n=1 Tax=Cannabis sativa TaxID=3483 RepID=A0A803PWF0_CANSA